MNNKAIMNKYIYQRKKEEIKKGHSDHEEDIKWS